MKPRFLNVDLEIESRTELSSLVADMGEKVAVLYSGRVPGRKRHLLAVETSRFLRKPDETIHVLCAVVEEFSPKARMLWETAQKRFDVGFELRPSERVSRFTLRTDTLMRVAKLGATLAVSYYRGERQPQIRGANLKSGNR